jgi:hypothetical protein
MTIILQDKSPEALRDSFLASKIGGRRATLIHTRDGVATACHGYHFVSGNLSLIKPDMSYIPVSETDTISYEDEN